MLGITTAFLVSFNISLVFEGGLNRELDRYHYSWHCYLSVTAGKGEKRYEDPAYFFPTDNKYLTSREIMEIKNIVDDLLEMEEDEHENNIPVRDDGFDSDSGAYDSS
jgi:hypothetical protein